jgi:outer membrane protein OmpA-like peptidoglycan-associated protein
MRKLNSTISVILTGILISILPTSVAHAEGSPAHLNLCSVGNYVLFANIITNAAGTSIISNYEGALVGSSSASELASLVGSEVGKVKNESTIQQHQAANSDLQLAIEAAASLATSGAQLLTGELSTENSPGSNLGTFSPGVYKTTAALNIVAGSTITLNGAGNYYFISGAALTVGAGVTISLTNGADAQNVYWVAGTVAGDMGLGANSILIGNFLARGTATFGAGAHLTGRLLVLNTVTLAASVVLNGIALDSSCATQAPTVPDLRGKLKSDVDRLLGLNYSSGTWSTTSTNATLENNLTIASYSPSGQQAIGTKINFITYLYSPTPGVLSISFTDATLAYGRAGDMYTDLVEAKTISSGTYSLLPVTYSLSGVLPSGLAFNPANGLLTGTISAFATAGTYNLTFSAYANGYPVKNLDLAFQVLPRTVIAIPAIASTKILGGTVNFDSGKSNLSPMAKKSLDQVIKNLNVMKSMNLLIYGHTDGVPGKSHSALSLARAKAVKTYLNSKQKTLNIKVSGLGVAPSKKGSIKSMQSSRRADIWVLVA